MSKNLDDTLPKISVIIPSFNKVKFIGSTLKSIFDQSYLNFEVIIQDGNSTDGTLGIIKEYIKKYPKIIKLESKKDNGQLDAINKGMQKATGDLLTFINADDVYVSKSFENIAQKYLSNKSSFWFAGRGIVINEKNQEIARLATLYKNVLLKINSYRLLLIVNYLIQPGVFFTKEAYDLYGPFTGTKNFVTEYELWLKLGKRKMPVVVDSLICRFRIEPTTITKTMFANLLSEDEKIVKKYTNNILILMLHKLNNLGRILIGRLV